MNKAKVQYTVLATYYIVMFYAMLRITGMAFYLVLLVDVSLLAAFMLYTSRTAKPPKTEAQTGINVVKKSRTTEDGMKLTEYKIFVPEESRDRISALALSLGVDSDDELIIRALASYFNLQEYNDSETQIAIVDRRTKEIHRAFDTI